MKITGRRILIQILGWDMDDYMPRHWCKKQNSKTKKWSKYARNFIKKDTRIKIKEYENNE